MYSLEKIKPGVRQKINSTYDFVAYDPPIVKTAWLKSEAEAKE